MSDPQRTTEGTVLMAACEICGHVHDPGDGRCDAHSHIGLGPCPCPGTAWRGPLLALLAAFERGEKLTYTGHLVVTDPDTEATVQMVCDEDDWAALVAASKSDARGWIPPASTSRMTGGSD